MGEISGKVPEMTLEKRVEGVTEGMSIWAVCFTAAGAKLLARIADKLSRESISISLWKKGSGPWPENERIKEMPTSLTEWMGEAFQKSGGILVIGAAGIAVRAAAPWIQDKFKDPPLVVMDEQGRFAIPVLSGHWGGANALAVKLAAITGGRAAITTATDVEGCFAADVFARENGLWISDRQAAKQVSADILAGLPVEVCCDFSQEGQLPRGLTRTAGGRSRLAISVFRTEGKSEKESEKEAEKDNAGVPMTLCLVPRLVTVGIGCRKGIGIKELKEQVMDCLEEAKIWPEAVEAIATIEIKSHEPAILSLCEEMGWSLISYSADELKNAAGEFSHSDFVEQTVGVGNVCERAAVLASGGDLAVKKQRRSGMTFAAALRPWRVKWDEEAAKPERDAEQADAGQTPQREIKSDTNDTFYTYSGGQRLRKGITTGTCAAAASAAAAALLLRQERLEQVKLLTPGGIRLAIPVCSHSQGEGWAACAVRKDAGDDPDVTNGILVQARVSRKRERDCTAAKEDGPWYTYQDEDIHLYLKGGQGIGMVTRAGLSCPPGMWAINPVPRQMIFEQTAEALRQAGESGNVWITISAPEGVSLAEKTFNPRLGIQGGISILGTSGIVEPMSQTALIETIRLEIRQRAEEGQENLLVTPGNYGRSFLEEQLGLSAERAVKCSNFIGETIDLAVQYGFKRLLLVGHGGKLVKLAAGIMNTHSSAADGRMECLAAWAGACGAGMERISRILSCIAVDEALAVLEEEAGLREAVMERVMEQIARHVRRRAGESLQVEVLLFTNERGTLGQTEGAEEMLRLMKCCS